jgi:hypothetical protein
MFDPTKYCDNEIRHVESSLILRLLQDDLCLTDSEIEHGIEFTLTASLNFAVMSNGKNRIPCKRTDSIYSHRMYFNVFEVWKILRRIFPNIPKLEEITADGMIIRLIPGELAIVTAPLFLKPNKDIFS